MRRTTILVAALTAVSLHGAGASARAEQHGFFRVIEGDATLTRVENGRPEAARENAPALAGDRVWLSAGARVEILLADDHRLRLADGADLELVALARSLDEDAEATVLHLFLGALALDVPRAAADVTRVDTAAASLFLEPGGLYLVEVDEDGYTRVVVRDGEAEMVTVDDGVRVTAGEQAETAAGRDARVELYDAPQLSDLELWAEELEAEAARAADVDALDPELRYAALPLERHGGWLHTDSGRAWRPRVAADWRPYWNGYWTYSPAGLVWSSHEPWGWVPYHYGYWDLHPAYGWLWYPAASYAPAHVVWYWGSSHVAWIPSGYYRSHYARRFGAHFSFGSGFHGVSHADWRAYRDWTFCPPSSIGFAHQHRFHRDHRVLAQRDGFSGHRRAFITADTGGLEPGRWRDPAAVEGAVLRRAHRRTGSEPGLRDVSAVVARSPEVSDSVLRDLDRSAGDVRRVASHRAAGPARGATQEPTVVTRRPVGPRGEPRAAAADLASDPPARSAVRSHRSSGVRTPAVDTVDRASAPRSRPTVDRAPALRSRPTVDRAPARPTVDRAPALRSRPTVDRAPAARSRDALEGRDRATPAQAARRPYTGAPRDRSIGVGPTPSARRSLPNPGVARRAAVPQHRTPPVVQRPVQRTEPSARALPPDARPGVRAQAQRSPASPRALPPPARVGVRAAVPAAGAPARPSSRALPPAAARVGVRAGAPPSPAATRPPSRALPPSAAAGVRAGAPPAGASGGSRAESARAPRSTRSEASTSAPSRGQAQPRAGSRSGTSGSSGRSARRH